VASKRKAPLRAVAPDEKAPVVEPPKTIAEATERDERSLLVALRKKAADEIDAGVPPAYLAQLIRQLREIDKEIRLLDARAEQEGAGYVGGADDEDFDASAI